jgi:hypothetical protein
MDNGPPTPSHALMALCKLVNAHQSPQLRRKLSLSVLKLVNPNLPLLIIPSMLGDLIQ